MARVELTRSGPGASCLGGSSDQLRSRTATERPRRPGAPGVPKAPSRSRLRGWRGRSRAFMQSGPIATGSSVRSSPRSKVSAPAWLPRSRPAPALIPVNAFTDCGLFRRASAGGVSNEGYSLASVCCIGPAQTLDEYRRDHLDRCQLTQAPKTAEPRAVTGATPARRPCGSLGLSANVGRPKERAQSRSRNKENGANLRPSRLDS